jgi:hypothetical protein
MEKTQKKTNKRPRKWNGPKSKVKDDVRDERKSNATKKEVANDPNWYLVNGQLAQNVANFSYNLATGERIHLAPDITTGTGLKPTNMRLPGVCAIHTGPSVGVANGATAPVNVAMKDIYSFVRHANSGHANYDAPDLMLYLLAADSVQTFWAYMVRAYGIARVYSQVNRYMGDAMLTAMGFNPDSLRSNMPQFLAFINQYAIKASVLAVPNTMTYFLRHQWMYHNIYMDEDNAKAQTYMYVPSYLYKYNINETTNAGELVPVWLCDKISANGVILTATPKAWTEIASIATDILNAMLSQEDCGIMSGDILKAYGSDKLFRFDQIPTEYAISPVYSEEVLEQFHNTDFLGHFVGVATSIEGTVKVQIDPDAAFTVAQDTGIGQGTLRCNPYVVGSAWNAYSKFLDFWKDDVTPEMSLVASRNKAHATLVNYGVVNKQGTAVANAIAMALESVGSEFVFCAEIFYYDSLTGVLSSIDVMPSSAATTTYNTAAVAQSTKFNEFPLLPGVAAGFLNMPVGEMSNFTVISGAEVTAMHNCAMLSMFGVPYRW